MASVSKPRVTAVVCSYYPERLRNVHRIVSDLRAGTVVPDRIIVLDNSPGSRFVCTPEIDAVVRAPFNSQCRGKFIAALFDASDYYLLMDDDTSVGPRSLEQFLAYARRGCCFGFWGVRLVNGSFQAGEIVFPSQLDREVPVDAFHGRVLFMAFDAVVKMLAAEEWVRIGPMLGRWPTEGDDLIAGMANDASCIPMRGDAELVPLSEEGVSMCSAGPDYFAGRDLFAHDLAAALRVHGKPNWT